jgi:hypothetical protein
MRRIVITPNNGTWSFERPGDGAVTADSALRAAIAAMAYGETLRGSALGYIIRLDHAGAKTPDEMITLHIEVF